MYFFIWNEELIILKNLIVYNKKQAQSTQPGSPLQKSTPHNAAFPCP